MRGLGLRVGSSALNYRALRAFGTRVPRWTGGRLPWLGLFDYTLRELPGADWVRLRPLLSGICGSDLSLLTGRSTAILSPFNSFPAILGHEVVARVEEAGAASGVQIGQRVVLDPIISCTMRGLDPCSGCLEGTAALCRHAAEGALAPGMLIGFCRDLPGGWSEGMLAHASQLHPVPDQLSDEAAVLVEPLACGLHAALAQPPAKEDRALVIGGGAIGLGTLAALRMIAPDTETTIVVRHPLQAELARSLGAHNVFTDHGGTGALRAAVEIGGAREHPTLVGKATLTGGFEVVYECAGNAASLEAALRVTTPRGRLAMIGSVGEVDGLDLTLAWARELRITGNYVYGRETSVPGQPHTIDHLMALLAAAGAPAVDGLVTHRFRLDDWRTAMRTAMARGQRAAIKVVFDHRAA
ncbi:MAG: zinc-binding dehydrogenase [Chloroflexota bacterium]|nr:zinc-binding dehydrogenase [Chloroflexota bacterium]